MGDDDLPLVRALQAGDDSSFNELIDRHKGALFGFIYRYVQNEADATELTQETFVRAYLKIRSFVPKARFVTWLFTIAINLCRDHVRSRNFREKSRTSSFDSEESDKAAELPSQEQSPSESAQTGEETQAIEHAIECLPHDLKTALILTAIEGLSHIEAAERLGTTPKTIETRLYRARKRLSEMLDI